MTKAGALLIATALTLVVLATADARDAVGSAPCLMAPAVTLQDDGFGEPPDILKVAQGESVSLTVQVDTVPAVPLGDIVVQFDLLGSESDLQGLSFSFDPPSLNAAGTSRLEITSSEGAGTGLRVPYVEVICEEIVLESYLALDVQLQTEFGNVDCGMDGIAPVDALKVLRSDAKLTVEADAGCPEIGSYVALDPTPGGEQFGFPPLWGDIDCSRSVDPIDALKILRSDAGLPVDQAADCTDPGSGVAVAPLDITWQQAVDLIENCFVKGVGQTHARRVGITMADGTTRRTIEPKLDDVIHVALASIDKCGPILIVTE